MGRFPRRLQHALLKAGRCGLRVDWNLHAEVASDACHLNGTRSPVGGITTPYTPVQYCVFWRELRVQTRVGIEQKAVAGPDVLCIQ